MSGGSQPQRQLALDAYRGFITLLPVSHGFGFGQLQDHPVLSASPATDEDDRVGLSVILRNCVVGGLHNTA